MSKRVLVTGGAGSGKSLFGIEFLVRGIVGFDEPVAAGGTDLQLQGLRPGGIGRMVGRAGMWCQRQRGHHQRRQHPPVGVQCPRGRGSTRRGVSDGDAHDLFPKPGVRADPATPYPQADVRVA